MFKKGDIVKYKEPSGSFYIQVERLNHDGTFSGAIIKTCEQFLPERRVGLYGVDWYVPYFEVVGNIQEPWLGGVTGQEDVPDLKDKIKHLEQRLIEAERNALYWTAFDCPVNRDVAERILRKES